MAFLSSSTGDVAKRVNGMNAITNSPNSLLVILLFISFLLRGPIPGARRFCSSDVAGLLALSEKSAFPTLSVSGFVGLPIMEMTVAGTAQDSHLIPFSCTGETPGTSPNRLQK